MRRLPLILGLTLIVAMTVWEIYQFFVTNEGIRFYASEPRRLVPVLLLGLAGGIVALGISRLSPDSQRTLKLTALGTFGTVIFCGLGYFAYDLVSVAATVNEAGSWVWIATCFLSMAVVDGLIWFEFRQVIGRVDQSCDGGTASPPAPGGPSHH